MSRFDGFLDNLAGGLTNPKGNLGDFRHASRLFIDESFKSAPKQKFLYHVTFFLTDPAQASVPEVALYSKELGILVKSADLPGFEANVETKNKYNRKKNVQTAVNYDPINIDFHDDNFGATTALLEAYFKYYYADSKNSKNSGAYGNRSATGNSLPGDTLYAGSEFNSYQFGLDNNVPPVPFFDRIEIAQMSRKTFTRYTLINPIISNWNHDSVDYSDGMGTMQNSITVNYDTVLYDRGSVEAGADGDPAGFGSPENYDVTPSPNSLQGGGDLGLLGTIGGIGNVITGYSGPLGTAIAGVNAVDALQNLSEEGLREEAFNLATESLGSLATADVSGLASTFIPKNRGRGGEQDVTQARPSVAPPSVRGIGPQG